MLFVIFGLENRCTAQTGARIFVTTLEDKISSTGGCSLQEAIYSANFDNNIAIDSINLDGTDHFITTECVAGSGDDTIILPTLAMFEMFRIVDDAHNPFGPTATPIIFSNITIEANGSQLYLVQFPPPSTLHLRAFSVGTASITVPGGASVSGTGQLTLKNAYVIGFSQKGGDGGCFAGGGMGAGGAVYVKDAALIIENSTFEANSATGGTGGQNCSGEGGGGGGLSGNGGLANFGGGGGGGARGDGGHGGILAPGVPGGFGVNSVAAAGGGGGGTLAHGSAGGADGQTGGVGGGACGARGGDANQSGTPASCPGGGGGGGGTGQTGGFGGNGDYGGGGGGVGGGAQGPGGHGGFGGGGGGVGGSGGFGGGGGFEGLGGVFGGSAPFLSSGGGAALGGTVFNDGGSITIRNSTFTSNFVTRGMGGNIYGPAGVVGTAADAGGVLFSRNGTITVINSTLSNNQATGSGAGIVVYQDGSPASLTLNNSILANNGAQECFFTGSVAITGAGNLIMSNGAGGSFGTCPGVVVSGDPQLGSLQLNSPGLTKTMAIPQTSPAFNAADPTTSLASDQRGVDRPQAGGFDIGAYELCLSINPALPPCQLLQIKPPPEIEPLTVNTSPANGGTTNPPGGPFSETFNSVVVLTATPNTGYRFVNWLGAVANAASPSTTVIMDQAQTVTAQFAPLPASMTGSLSAKSGPQNGRVWALSLLDNGPGVALGTTIHDFTLTQTYGAACTPIVSNAFPLSLSNLSPGQTVNTSVTINFAGCALTARFTARFSYSANNGAVSGFLIRYNQYE
jgi:hypothetical protein